jgi:hypothetical protein
VWDNCTSLINTIARPLRDCCRACNHYKDQLAVLIFLSKPRRLQVLKVQGFEWARFQLFSNNTSLTGVQTLTSPLEASKKFFVNQLTSSHDKEFRVRFGSVLSRNSGGKTAGIHASQPKSLITTESRYCARKCSRPQSGARENPHEKLLTW